MDEQATTEGSDLIMLLLHGRIRGGVHGGGLGSDIAGGEGLGDNIGSGRLRWRQGKGQAKIRLRSE